VFFLVLAGPGASALRFFDVLSSNLRGLVGVSGYPSIACLSESEMLVWFREEIVRGMLTLA